MLRPMLAESCIDIVIPTMWIPDGVPERIALYASHPLISKVVVIDNDQFAVSRKTAEHFPPNVEILVQSSNIFVNQAWNIGVQCCSAPFVCIANDDIVIDPRLFHQILSLDWIGMPIDLIGLAALEPTKKTVLTRFNLNRSLPLGSQCGGFGSCMFLRRECYRAIPPQLKVYFGDDYLVHKLSCIYKMQTPFVTGCLQVSIAALLSQGASSISDVMKSDDLWARQHLLD